MNTLTQEKFNAEVKQLLSTLAQVATEEGVEVSADDPKFLAGLAMAGPMISTFIEKRGPAGLMLFHRICSHVGNSIFKNHESPSQN